MTRLAHDTWLLVADGARAILMRNDGDADYPFLKVVRAYKQDNAPNHELGTDKPGRTISSSGTRHGGMEPTDWHQIAEDKFIAAIADDLLKDVQAKAFKKLVIAAPPVALGVLRKAMNAQVLDTVIAEFNKDYTRLSTEELEKTVLKALKAKAA